MPSSIHGHEVLHLLLAQGRGLTREAMRALIDQRFGPDARFHTCSVQGMSSAQLVTFFEVRGKVRPEGDELVPDPSRICKHGDAPDHHHDHQHDHHHDHHER